MKMKKPVGKPYSETRLVKYIDKRIVELRHRKTQAAISAESGFKRPNVLAMIKSGAIKLPLDRVPALAKALECDPARLFTMAVEQLGGDTTDRAIRDVFGTIVTENEAAWIEEIRKASRNSDPSLTTRARSAIWEIFGK